VAALPADAVLDDGREPERAALVREIDRAEDEAHFSPVLADLQRPLTQVETVDDGQQPERDPREIESIRASSTASTFLGAPSGRSRSAACRTA
jgi:hypothetical protein